MMGRLIDADKLRKQMSEDYAQSVSKISNPTVKAIVEKAVETFDGYIVSAETVDAIPVDWLMRKADERDSNKKINDWIPISEHPPYEDGIYIVTILYEGEYYVERLLYSKGNWMPIDSLNFVGIKGVIAWKDDDYYKEEE